jgi:hypothetical protein
VHHVHRRRPGDRDDPRTGLTRQGGEFGKES